ncbi:MAG TPA: peptidoglycan recognition family protein [Pseudoflavonifractor sp.]|nr:peptidoglycan recognition family protein [Pseudoflavonifractor sp.]
MTITEHILTKNDCWKEGRTITPSGVMVHSPGVAQPNVDVFLNTWNVPGYAACVHAFVTKDGAVQTLPWNWRGWHAGSAAAGKVSANNTHIGFEILEPAGHTYDGSVMVGYDSAKNAAYFAAVYRNAVELTAQLCKKYELDPLAPGVVICHAEGYALGVASNHADVNHWFPKHDKSMDLFRADVKSAMEGGEEEMTQQQFEAMLAAWQQTQAAAPVSAWAKEAWEQAVAKGIFDGTQPRGPLTREQAALVFSRLGLLD